MQKKHSINQAKNLSTETFKAHIFRKIPEAVALQSMDRGNFSLAIGYVRLTIILAAWLQR
jgi:hypothetical protein